MNPDLGLKVLASIMDWDDDRAHDEYAWLTLMAQLKYDDYRDFQAGVRFSESLAAWLQQFERSEREVAYRFVKERLVYIGPNEMEKLVEQFYNNFVLKNLVASVAADLGIQRYEVYANEEAGRRIAQLRRQTLFLGMSDGARVDYIRHQNVGRITNEQIVGSTQLDEGKWKDLLNQLRGDPDHRADRFRAVYLIDDFAGTGTSFFRYDPETNEPKGKLIKFGDSLMSANDGLDEEIFEQGFEVYVHHYVGTAKARGDLQERLDRATDVLPQHGLPPVPVATYGMTLPEGLPLSHQNPDDMEFLALTDKYYDPAIETKHTDVGGTSDMKLGYGACALPLILDHNTPNNAISLLWAETSGETRNDETQAPAMRPLFRRRQRHV